jgi:tight adherence protein C
MTFGLPPDLAAVVFVGATALVIAAASGFASLLQSRASVRRRLVETPGGGHGAPAAARRPSAIARTLEDLGAKTAPRDAERLSQVRLHLVQAGFSAPAAPYWFFGARLVGMIAAQLPVLWAWDWLTSLDMAMAPVAATVGAAVVGYGLPAMVVGMWRGKAIDQARDGFPDLMDLLVACIEAGLGLDAGLQRVAKELERRYPPLAAHLETLTRELRAGRSRHHALAAFADRTGLDEARALATMLRQSEEMGTSLGDTLRVFSEDMRAKRMLRAEEKALALPAKLVVPLVLFIFPTIIGVLMLPAAISLGQAFGD